MDNRPIGVFDSGLGGLTGVRELRKRLPHEDIIYFGDSANCPYGNKNSDQIFELSSNGKYRCIYCEQELQVKPE